MTAEASRTHKGNYWAWAPVVLLSLTLAGWGYMIAKGVNDPSFSVEESYYEKASNWDARQKALANSEALGFRASFSVEAGSLAVTLADRTGAPVSGATARVVAFHNAHAADRRKLTLEEVSPGVYRSKFDIDRPGLWELHLVASNERGEFLATRRLDLGGHR